MTDRPIADEYRIDVFAESSVTADDVLALWQREGAIVERDEAVRRVQEVLVASVHVPTGELVGVSSAYLASSPQLRMNLWWMRALVAADHRRQLLARAMTQRSIDWLEHRFVTGADRRGSGVALIGQNDELKRTRTEAVLPGSRFMFIGETERGHRIRVRYFAGAEVPLPS